MRYSHTVVRLASETLLRGGSGIFGKLKSLVPGRLFRLPGYHFLGAKAFYEAAMCGEVEGDRPDVVQRLLDGTVKPGSELGVIDEALGIERFTTNEEEMNSVIGALQQLADIIAPNPKDGREVPPLVGWIRGLAGAA